MSDLLAFFLSIMGIGLAVWYIHKVWFYFGEPKYEEDYDKKLSESIKTKLTDLEKDRRLNAILKDYETSNIEIQRRDNITLLIGSILITGSLLVLAYTISERVDRPLSMYALVSIGLYSIWLLVLHDTSKKLDNLSYYRIKAIEKALTEHLGYEFGIHSYIFKATHTTSNEKTKTVLWLRRRRVFWGIILFLLSFAWMLLSSIW